MDSRYGISKDISGVFKLFFFETFCRFLPPYAIDVFGLPRFETKAAVSLGQGQGPKAEFAINEGKTGGASKTGKNPRRKGVMKPVYYLQYICLRL